jgi:hypothetical protein
MTAKLDAQRNKNATSEHRHEPECAFTFHGALSRTNSCFTDARPYNYRPGWSKVASIFQGFLAVPAGPEEILVGAGLHHFCTVCRLARGVSRLGHRAVHLCPVLRVRSDELRLSALAL